MNQRANLRNAAKKLYKEQIKNVPKKQRVPFADFFKQYKKVIRNKSHIPDKTEQEIVEDFDFDDLVNTITDDDVE